MHIREIAIKDNRIMEQIIKRSLEEFQLDIPGTAYFDPELGRLAQYYQQKKAAKYWVLVTNQDEVVGGVGIAPYDTKKGVCELQKLYLSKEVQGKGQARRLMDTALQFAEKHYTYCYLETMDIMENANRLYKKYGFELLEKPLSGSIHHTMDAWYLKKL